MLPDHVDLRPWCPPAGDQHGRNSCTAWALGYGVTTIKNNIIEDRRSDDPFREPDLAHVFSPAYLFNIVKHELDDRGCDDGVALAKPISVLADAGCCTWSEFPYDTSKWGCATPVPRRLMREQSARPRSRPLRIQTTDLVQWKYYLSRNEPIALHLRVDGAFQRQGLVAGGKEFFMWEPDSTNVEGHAVVCVGYDDRDSTFLILNSWGRDWGYAGLAKIRYATMREPHHCMEAYIFENALAESPLDRATALSTTDPSAPVLNTTLGLGQRIQWHGLSIALLAASPAGDRIELSYSDTQSGTPIGTFAYSEGQRRTFVLDGQAITASWSKGSPDASAGNVSITMVWNEAEQWAHLWPLLQIWHIPMPK